MRRRDREVRYQPQHSHLAPPAGHAAAGCLAHGIPDGRSDSGFGSHAEATLAGGLARRPSRRHRDGGKRLRPPARCRPHAPSRNQRMITFIIILSSDSPARPSRSVSARLKENQRDACCGARPFGVAGHVKVTVLGVRLDCRRERAFGDDARSKNYYRDEVGSGSKRLP